MSDFGILFIKDRRIHHIGFFYHRTCSINDISSIYYHYDAAVGAYEASWEFKLLSGGIMSFSYLNLGVGALLRHFEALLPGFSRKRFKKQFEEGDVVDSLCVWRSQEH